jgi:hypothetical protein
MDMEISTFDESNENNDFWLIKSKSSTRAVFVIAKKEHMDMLRNKLI